MSLNKQELKSFKEKLETAWCEESCYPGSWDPSRPCKGQCEPTACLVQDIFGGDIYKLVGDPSIGSKGAHFFNLIDGEWIDLTAEQFAGTPAYNNGKIVEGRALSQLRTHSRYNRKERYQVLKNKIEEL